MPNYDYRCLDCKRRFEIFLTYQEYGTTAVACRHCGSQNVQRRIGRIRVLRSEDSRLDDLADGRSWLERNSRAAINPAMPEPTIRQDGSRSTSVSTSRAMPAGRPATPCSAR